MGGTSLGPCGCDLLEGRCARHRAMMEAIHDAWYGLVPMSGTTDAIWALSDGYGTPGFVPAQGHDWSGIRDSSIGAVEAMYAAATGGAR